MSIKMRMNNDNEILICGTLYKNEEKIHLDKNGNLYVDKVYYELEGVNTNNEVDDAYDLDDNHDIDDNSSMETFLNWFFDIESTQVAYDGISFVEGKHIIANGIKTNMELESD